MTLATSLEDYLVAHDAHYTLEHHAASMCSSDTARSACVDEERLAKSVVLEDERGFVLAVLPASRRLELGRVRQEMGRALHLSTERDLPRLFPDCELGAVPPLGAAYGLETVLDASLESCDEVYFEGGDHETLVRMEGGEFLDLLENAAVAEIATEPARLVAALVTRERLYGALLAVGRAIAAPVGASGRWRSRLRRELTRLSTSLDEHIRETEDPTGVLAEIEELTPRLAREVELLRGEHRSLKQECIRLREAVEGAESSLTIRKRVHTLLRHFEEHRHRGADVVYESFGVDIGGG